MQDDDGDVSDCAQEGMVQISKLEEWAVEDVQQAYRGDPVKHFYDTIDARKPDGWHPKTWHDACVNYFIESYRDWRVHGDERDLTRVMTRNECAYIAMRESYEFIYCQVNPGRFKPSSLQYRNF